MITPAELKRDAVEEIINEYIVKKSLTFSLKTINLNEDIKKQITNIIVRYDEGPNYGSVEVELTGKGKGMAAALFNALKEKYGEQYRSVNSILFEGVRVKTFMEKGSENSEIEFEIDFRNGRKEVVTFRARRRSIAVAAALTVMRSFEFYINSELAFHRMRDLLADAKKRGRSDISSRLISDLSKIVEFNCYDPRR